MLCKQTPNDISAYYITKDTGLVYELIDNDIHPLYSKGEYYYFLKTGRFEKYMSIRRQKSLRKEGSNAI